VSSRHGLRRFGKRTSKAFSSISPTSRCAFPSRRHCLPTMPLRENLEGWVRHLRGNIGYEIRRLEVHTAADVAYAHSLNHMTGARADGTPDADLWFRETMACARSTATGASPIVHESVPFKMDGSFQAAIDLKP